jgi:dihydroorotate dehydrogenase (NAD+) catalytic subunit
VKLSPRVQDIAEFAKIAQGEGMDAISAINTIPAMAVDIRTKKPVLANKIGGLSGPAIKPIALRMVYEVSRVVEIPVIGIGGIMSAEDAIEFLLAGASAVAIGTANFINPRAAIDVLEGIERYMSENNIGDIRELIKAF